MLGTLSRISLALSLVTAGLGGAGCSRAAREGPPPSGPPVVTFTNESLDMTTVYAIRSGGDAVRVGTVPPGRTERLRLPVGITNGGPINIIAVPLAGRRAASTGPLSLGPGERLSITLPVGQNILSVLPATSP